jgi:hypothetical protein
MSYGKQLAFVVLSASLLMQGCTTASKNVPAKYTPPAQYEAYNCYQLAVEFQRVQGRLIEIGGQLDEESSKDGLMGAFGAIVFFPALLMMGGHTQQEADYAVLRGEAEAMRQVAFQKKCTAASSSSAGTPPK